MPNLMDLAKISVNKQNVTTPYKAFNKVLNNNVVKKEVINQPEIKLQNKLKTDVKIISENSQYGTYPKESTGIFASWQEGLNREPKTDEFKLGSINNVKTIDENKELKEEIKTYKLKKWLQDVDARIKHAMIKK